MCVYLSFEYHTHGMCFAVHQEESSAECNAIWISGSIEKLQNPRQTLVSAEL